MKSSFAIADAAAVVVAAAFVQAAPMAVSSRQARGLEMVAPAGDARYKHNEQLLIARMNIAGPLEGSFKAASSNHGVSEADASTSAVHEIADSTIDSPGSTNAGHDNVTPPRDRVEELDDHGKAVLRVKAAQSEWREAVEKLARLQREGRKAKLDIAAKRKILAPRKSFSTRVLSFFMRPKEVADEEHSSKVQNELIDLLRQELEFAFELRHQKVMTSAAKMSFQTAVKRAHKAYLAKKHNVASATGLPN